jgi:hypothetical protein
MRPLVSLSTFLSLFSAVAFVAAETTESIYSQDGRISYSQGWKFVSPHALRVRSNPPHLSPTQIYSDGGTLAFNNEASGTATLRVYSERLRSSSSGENVDQMMLRCHWNRGGGLRGGVWPGGPNRT